jgi:RNA polymerase sigma-70 factor (ECF subfamily)
VRKRSLILSLFAQTDEQAMWRVQSQGDHQAFGRLVERWEKPILQLCARMTGDAHRGEDLKQEAFVRVFARRADFRPEAKFSTWLWRIALNLCYDELRKTKRRSECALENDPDDAANAVPELASDEPAPDRQLVQAEEGHLVRQALLRLSEECRTVLVLRYCEGLKLREIAEILDLPKTTVCSRIALGLSQISRILEPKLDQSSPALLRAPSAHPEASL